LSLKREEKKKNCIKGYSVKIVYEGVNGKIKSKGWGSKKLLILQNRYMALHKN